MFFYNACKKCITGTVELRNGIDGPELKCVNCSHAVPFDTASSAEMQKIA